MNDQDFMHEALRLAKEGMRNGDGGPFGAIVVKDGKIIGRGCNQVASLNDPTAHAEIMAIRDACRRLGQFQLDGCTIYTSCEPCPMCLGAIYWARPERIVYAGGRHDAAAADFDDDFIYREIVLPPHERQIRADQMLQEEARKVFEEWIAKKDKVRY
jgi:guanine deaminase